MGWCRDGAPGHEGYVVGIEQFNDGRWRELSNGYDEAHARVEGGIRITHLQVACDCGWRSPRLVAPLHTRWHPFYVEFYDEHYEEQAANIWDEHIEQWKDREDDQLLVSRLGRRRPVER